MNQCCLCDQWVPSTTLIKEHYQVCPECAKEFKTPTGRIDLVAFGLSQSKPSG